MTATATARRLLLPLLIGALFGVLALLPVTDASAASAAKSCTLTGTNSYTCTFTITPGVATGAGSWLVQMVPGTGTFVGTSTVTSVSGCTGSASVTAGTQITTPSDIADYDVTIGAGGCDASAVVVVTETVTVTASGQLCQKVWVTAGSPFATSCATVVYTPPPPPPTPSAAKSCVLTDLNLYTCTLTITPGIATGAGAWLVQMVPGPGVLVGTSTVTSVSGCTGSAAVTTGTQITTPSDIADYDVMIGTGGCDASAVVVVTETVTVTSSGQICQKVWVTTASPFMVACATVVYTAPPPPVPAASATKSCTLTSTANVYTCLYTVTPAFPAASAPPSPNGDYIHVNEPPGPPMSGPGTFIGTPTVVSVSGCGSTALPVTSTSSTSYNAWMGVGGCAGTAWSVTFSETVAVTADGQICQSFWMVAAVDPVTACATVAFTKSLPTGDGKFTTAPNFGTGAVAQVVFGGGTVDDLEVSMVGAGATGVWVQDSTGAFQLLIANGPAFLKDAFALKFPGGFATVVGVTLVR